MALAKLYLDVKYFEKVPTDKYLVHDAIQPTYTS